MLRCFDVAVVGGGAAGLAAAISAARKGVSTVICDRMSRLGKKILVTGGGRCNLTNENLAPGYYTATDKSPVESVFGRIGNDDIQHFFRGLGLEVYSEGGRVFPVTNQASSVLHVLEMEIRRLGIAVELGFETSAVEPSAFGFRIEAGPTRKIEANSVILAGGGMAYPALGSDGSGHRLAQKLGHHIIPPVPSAVPLLVNDKMCHVLQGQKMMTRAAAMIDGKPAGTAGGDVLFTQYGLSGTVVLDVSESLSIALHRDKNRNVAIVLDLVPFMTQEALAAEFERRMKAGWVDGELGAGILPYKFAALIPEILPTGHQDQSKKAHALAVALKEKRFTVHGTRGWNEAEFTSGGVDAGEVDPRTLESRLCKGIFFAGEILDVQGKRGGFNLAWAWASGLVAGLSATDPSSRENA
jgi:predicted Rossmann fold flavoprotein